MDDKINEKRFSFSGRVSGYHILSTMTAVYTFDEVRRLLDELELSLQPSGWTLKEPCEGCEEEKKKTARRKKATLLEPEQEDDNVTAVGILETDDS